MVDYFLRYFRKTPRFRHGAALFAGILTLFLCLSVSFQVSGATLCKEKIIRKIPLTRRLVFTNCEHGRFKPGQRVYIYSEHRYVGSATVGSIYSNEIYTASLDEEIFASVKQGDMVINLSPGEYEKVIAGVEDDGNDRGSQSYGTAGKGNRSEIGAGTTAALEMVNLFPSDYLGQLLIFDEVWLGEIVEKDFFTVAVTSRKGTYIDPGLSGGKITFIISQETLKNLEVYGVKANYRYKVRLTCRIEKIGLYFVASIEKIDFFRSSGEIHGSITAGGVVTY